MAGYTRLRTKPYWPPGFPLPPLTRSVPRLSRNQPWRDSADYSTGASRHHSSTSRDQLGPGLHIPPTQMVVEMIAVLLKAPSSRNLEIRLSHPLLDDSWTPRGICRPLVPGLTFLMVTSSRRFFERYTCKILWFEACLHLLLPGHYSQRSLRDHILQEMLDARLQGMPGGCQFTISSPPGHLPEVLQGPSPG